MSIISGKEQVNGYNIKVDYRIFETASNNVNELNTTLEESRKNIFNSKEVICSEDVFAGPVADACKDALEILDSRVTFAVDNFSTIHGYFGEVETAYKNADAAAALKVVSLDENGAVVISNMNADAVVDANTGWVWPLGKNEKWILTSHNEGGHHGIDIATYGKQGAPIYSAMGGEVLASGWNSAGYGNWVKVRLDNGLIAIYGHMSNSQAVVKKGDRIEAGQMIGNVGTTGNSSGPHIHFELRNANDTGSLDPLSYYQSLKSA